MKSIALWMMGLMMTTSLSLMAQDFSCETWEGKPNKSEGEEAHSVYRQALKSKDYELAFEYWQKAFEVAPAADGKRDYHLMNGIDLYKHKLEDATSDEEKKMYKDKIVELYKHAVHCYEQRAFDYPGCDEDCYEQKVGTLLGRMGYDLYYTVNADYKLNYDVLKRALDINDKTAEYIVLEPLANIAVYRFKQGKLEAEDMRQLHAKIEEVGDYNIENDPDYGEYYDISRKRALAAFKDIEADIFDCAYFKKKLLPIYEADPENFEVIKQVAVSLKRRGCGSDDPDYAALESKYASMAATYNAEIQAEFEAKNPHVKAKKLYDAGDFKGAVGKYEQAIANATDPAKKAKYLFSKASIEGRKLGQLSAAKKSLKEAASLRTDWGRPYMLLGDLYAIQSRKCSGAWDRGLAVLAAISQYSKAKSVDPSVSAEASSRIAKYQSSKPDGEEAFMQGMKAGQTVNVGCGIGESVRLSFR